MATLSGTQAPPVGDERFFLRSAIIMAAIIVAGFSMQLAMGRSTFASPVRVHLHAVLFMGWVAIYLTQNILVANDRIDLHRRLGWVAAVWMIPRRMAPFAPTGFAWEEGRMPETAATVTPVASVAWRRKERRSIGNWSSGSETGKKDWRSGA